MTEMRICPKCGGGALTVLSRAWCIEPYVNGGCGGFYERRGERWVRR